MRNLFIEFLTQLGCADRAHDIDHIERVVATARQLGACEGAELAILEPAAWLHDCVSVAKDHPQRKQASLLAADRAVAFLQEINYPQQYHQAIHHAIVAHSFSANITPETLEAKILQDADRMDALGAIGIVRCILVGGKLNRQLYSSIDPLCVDREPNDDVYTLDHFFTKLLMLGESMNTQAAKAEAERRSVYMRDFLAQLQSELLTHE
ncbi:MULTISPECIES: HD domain-containing protein [unclassified Moritella]|uniref:HD domain-containing protein n=1 Tax=unclassified Moritella TaxID=2637987 RepID=UPI001BA8F2CE|nr:MULTISPECIES: HD domain-containing protein [unclassified Moritella]QUM86602.1 HD domain-containing protein [Moritella sp. 28]QUM90829.1 HD domain-containing protein [Moritella sp. 36]